MKILMNPLRRIITTYSNRSFRTKMLIMAFIVNLAAISSFIAVYYYQATGILRDEIIANNQGVLLSLSREVKDDLNEAVSVLYWIRYDRTVLDVIRRDGGRSMEEELADIGRVRNILTNLTLRQVNIYFKQDRIYTKEGSRFATLADAAKFPWYQNTRLSEGDIYWSKPYKNEYGQYLNVALVSAARAIMEPDSENLQAVISVDIYTSILFKRILMQTSEDIRGQIFIINEEGIIISAIDSSTVGENINNIPDFSSYKYTAGGAQFTPLSVILTQKISDPDWYIVGRVPLNNFAKKNSEIYRKFIISAVVLFGLLFLFNALISTRFSRRLHKLLDTIQDPVEGIDDWEKSRDEIMVLGRKYEVMENRNRRMAGEIYNISLQRKEAQLSALQAQLNPHFLYNQLDAINWMAHANRTGDVVEAVRLLSKFYRQALSKGKDVVTVDEEIKHLQSFMDLQRIHYGDDIKLVIKKADEVADCLVLKMLLQPLVENSIMHGILEKDEQTGTVTVEFRRSEKQLIITVIDDGTGIPPAVLKRLRDSETASSTKSGYGYRNVEHRIKAYFGEAYGLAADNLADGCIITINLPVLFSRSV